MPLTAIKGPYIPRADGRFREWLDNFAAVVAREPWAVGLTPADAQALLELAERYTTAYVRATSPQTRGPVSVTHKNTVRREAWDAARPIAMRIKRHAGISRSHKVALGIYPPLESQSRIARPRSAPRLEVLEGTRGRHRLRFGDPASPTRLAKPYGAVSMQLLIAVGDDAARSPEGIGRMESKSRHVFDVKFAPADSGKTATYFGRWVTRRGKTGPWSRAVAMVIA